MSATNFYPFPLVFPEAYRPENPHFYPSGTSPLVKFRGSYYINALSKHLDLPSGSPFSSTNKLHKMHRIDVHHHFFPPDLDKGKLNQKNGWITPAGTLPWNPQVSLTAMDAAAIDIAILSLPALSTGSVSGENRSAARNRNLFVSGIVEEHPTRFGFFATLPFLDDVEGESRWDERCSYYHLTPLRLLGGNQICVRYASR